MSEVEDPMRSNSRHEVTVDDIRQLGGASTPHFALQIRNRIEKLIADLDASDPARSAGEQEIRRLETLAAEGERRGPVQEGEKLMPSLGSEVIPRSS